MIQFLRYIICRCLLFCFIGLCGCSSCNNDKPKWNPGIIEIPIKINGRPNHVLKYSIDIVGVENQCNVDVPFIQRSITKDEFMANPANKGIDFSNVLILTTVPKAGAFDVIVHVWGISNEQFTCEPGYSIPCQAKCADGGVTIYRGVQGVRRSGTCASNIDLEDSGIQISVIEEDCECCD